MTDDALPSSRLPDVIGGRYRIVSRLGVGGMGVVYKAIDQQLNRPVAVKAVEDRRLLMPGTSGRLRTEALAAASLDHPYICKVYELVETPTEAFIVMEFVEGETLSSILKRGVPSLQQALHICREVAEGLAEAHSHGLVHRDVKPANVMVTPSGHVKLLDFGVAGADVSLPAADHTRTHSPQLTVHAGTPQYMAPEQASGQPITARADLFSLGVMLYECISGALPFSGSTTFDYVRHVMQSPPRRLDRVAPDTPAQLVELVERCLEKTPADRPASAASVVSLLRQFEDQLTAPTGSLPTARQARAGRRWKVVAAVAVVVAAIAVAWTLMPNRESDDAPRQVRPFVTTSAVESNSQISPDAAWISYIANTAGSAHIMVQRIDGGEARPLTLGPGQPQTQVWSPDGSQIAAVFKLDGAFVLQVYPAFFGGAPVLSVPVVPPVPGMADGTPPKINSVKLLRWAGRDIYAQLNIQNLQSVLVSRIPMDSPSAAVELTGAWTLDGTLRPGIDIRADAKSAVFSVIKNSQEDLWTINLDGSGLRQLTADAHFDKDPHWIGAGDRVVFQSNRGGQIDLWQIDVRTQAMTALTTGEGEEIAESTSADGRIISFKQLTSDANIWTFSGGDSQQLTQDSLSDYAPVLSGDGKTIAFQRSQPTPSQGYALLDAKVFVAPYQPRTAIDARPLADGFAADLSEDGHYVSYMQRGEDARHMTLVVRDLRAGASTTLTKSAGLPSLSLVPIEWSSRMTAWSHESADLYFVDQRDGDSIRRYRAGQPEAGPALAKVAGPGYPRDLEVSRTTGRLGYLTATRDKAVVYELDPETGSVRTIASFTGESEASGLFGRGWIDRRFLLVRPVRINEDKTADVEVLLTNERGGASVIGRIPGVWPSTIRVHAASRVLYVARAEKGTNNVYQFMLDTGQLTPLTQNALPGVTYSGFQPIGAQSVLGVREERREDIWLIEQAARPRPGNQAGR